MPVGLQPDHHFADPFSPDDLPHPLDALPLDLVRFGEGQRRGQDDLDVDEERGARGKEADGGDREDRERGVGRVRRGEFVVAGQVVVVRFLLVAVAVPAVSVLTSGRPYSALACPSGMSARCGTELPAVVALSAFLIC